MANLSTTVQWNTIESITHPKIAQKISDNITNRIPYLFFISKQGNKEYEDGGVRLHIPVFKELPAGQAYSGNSTLGNTESDPFTTAIYERKQLTVPIIATGTKMLQNSGSNPEAVVNYMAAIVEAAEEGMKDLLASSANGLFSANGESDLGVTGLQNILTDSTTTGTVGGLSRATYAWWQHQSDSVSTNFSTDGLLSMDTLFLACSRGDETSSLIIMTRTGFVNLKRALTGTVNYYQPTGQNIPDGGYSFPHIWFDGVPVIFDDGVPTNRAYFLNLKYLKLLVHRDRDMTIRDWIAPTDQDSLLARIYWAGNQVTSNLSRQGILQGTIETYS